MNALGADVSEQDIRSAESGIERAEGRSRNWREVWTPGVRRALVVVCVFFIFQQITGINVPLYYGPHLLGPIFAGAHAAGADHHRRRGDHRDHDQRQRGRHLPGLPLDRQVRPRRKLAIGGYTGMIVFALVSAAGLAFRPARSRLVVIMIGLDFFIASFAVGVGGTGWTLQGEVFPTAVRGQAAAFAAMVDWLANFALIEIFPVWQNAISLAGVLVCLRGPVRAGHRVHLGFLPETKGLPVEEIVKIFERQQQNPPEPAGVHA